VTRLLLALDGLDAQAFARGLVAGGLEEPDVYDLADGLDATFDARLRAAFAVVVGEPRLDRDTLRGRLLFEIATRARQAGVPCHAVVGDDALDPFAKRILDLQYVLTGDLEAAGAWLAAQLMTDVMPN
jgi:glycerate kinase